MAPERLEGRSQGRSSTRSVRPAISNAFGLVEDAFSIAIAAALAVGGAVLFVDAVVTFAREFGEEPTQVVTLTFLDALLLVFIVSELILTLRGILVRRRVFAVPFLVVGIVSVIRRVLVVGAETAESLGTPEFRDLLLELGVLFVGILLLAIAIRVLASSEEEAPAAAAETSADDDPPAP